MQQESDRIEVRQEAVKVDDPKQQLFTKSWETYKSKEVEETLGDKKVLPGKHAASGGSVSKKGLGEAEERMAVN